MAVITDPKTGIIVSAPKGSDQWTDAKKARRWLTWALSRVVSDTACATLPASPVEGQAVIVSGGTNANAIARYSTDLGAWEYMAPWAGLVVQDTSGADWIYSGSAWAVRPSGGGTVISGSDAMGPAWPIDAATDIGWGNEFDSSAELSQWTIENAAGLDSYGVRSGYLYAVPNTPDANYVGFYKAAPAGTSWTILAKMRASACLSQRYAFGGLYIRNSANARSCMWVVAQTGAWPYLSRYEFSSPTARKSYDDATSRLGNLGDSYYLRLERSGDTLTVSGSQDGETWWTIEALTISTSYPGGGDQIGFAVGNNGASGRTTQMLGWIRRVA